MLLNELADVGDACDMFEESSMRARHVRAHLVDKVVTSRRRLRLLMILLIAIIALFLACGPMFDAEDEIEELYQGALSIAAAPVLTIGFRTTPIFENHAVRQSGFGHVFASG